MDRILSIHRGQPLGMTLDLRQSFRLHEPHSRDPRFIGRGGAVVPGIGIDYTGVWSATGDAAPHIEVPAGSGYALLWLQFTAEPEQLRSDSIHFLFWSRRYDRINQPPTELSALRTCL